MSHRSWAISFSAAKTSGTTTGTTLYEAFEKVAQLFQEEERYEAFKALHDEFIADIQTQLPPADERPNVLLVYAGSDQPEEFSPYRLNDQGTSKKQWHDLGVSDALAGTGVKGLSTTDRGKIDYETMLEIDPDVILLRAHERKSATEFRDTVLDFMQSHPVASELKAVKTSASTAVAISFRDRFRTCS